MSKQQKIIHTVLLFLSLHTVNLFALPADEQDLSTTSVTQTAVRQFMETASTVNQLIGQHTPTYLTDKLTAKGAALTAGMLMARVVYTYCSQNAPKPAIPFSPALRLHQDQRGQVSLPPLYAKAFPPTYTQYLFQNVPSQSLTQAVIEDLKTDVSSHLQATKGKTEN